MNERVRVKGVTIHRPIIYGNTALPIPEEERSTSKNPDHTFRWTVAVRSPVTLPNSKNDLVGGTDDLSYFIKRVTFKLHDTYPNPNRNLDKPPFEITETGWGEFEIGIRITFVPESGEKALSLHHHLKLHQWSPNGTALDPSSALSQSPSQVVHSWQYDEIVFHEPYQAFHNILMSYPPTPLPNTRKKTVPPLQYPQDSSTEANNKVETPEFTAAMEKDEAERLESARKTILAETEKLKQLLLAKEKELTQLKKQVDGA